MSVTRPQFGNGQMIVNVQTVDPVNQTASGMFLDGSECPAIDTRYHVGAVSVNPAIGEQWVVERASYRSWKLVSKMPIHTPEIAVPQSAGQSIVGGSGEVTLVGSVINALAPISLATHTADTRPDASAYPAGSQIFDTGLNKPIYSTGTVWVDSAGVEVT